MDEAYKTTVGRFYKFKYVVFGHVLCTFVKKCSFGKRNHERSPQCSNIERSNTTIRFRTAKNITKVRSHY